VVVLREIEGFTYEEIADILQTNLGTVKSRLTRGRAALRVLLAPERPIAHPVPAVAEHYAHPAAAHRTSGHAEPVLTCAALSRMEVSR